MFVNDVNTELAGQLEGNKALFDLGEDEGNPLDTSKSLEPTLDNLMQALNDTKVQSKEYLHVASKMVFEVCPMSSAGYISLHNVEQFNPMTNTKISNNQDDERERNIVYLMHGIAKPKITRAMAEQILDAPGWGPSNIGLIDAIMKVNPSAEQRVNNFMVLMGLARFQVIFLRVLEEVGGFDKLLDGLNIKQDVKESLRTCIDMFSHLFVIDETSKVWGVNLGIGDLTTEGDKEE
jgi:hypothetical protein